MITPETTSEDAPGFIGPVQWDREHLKIVKAGKDAIDQWQEKNPCEWLRLNHALLAEAHLEGANLLRVHLEGAKLSGTHLEGAKLSGTRLEKSILRFAHMEKASLLESHLEGADLRGAYLEGADLTWTHLEGTNLQMAIVDGATKMDNITVDDNTDLTGVGLGNVRIQPHIRSHLEYNIRRIGWKKLYKKNKWYRLFPGMILWLSDYGYRSHRLVFTFIVFALVFAAIYLIPTQAPSWLPNGLTFECNPFVENLEVFDDDGNYLRWTTWTRALYFSVVTMTTLGFGDMYAYPESALGHCLLILHVVIGYVLLGALITRFAILFQSVEG